MPIRLGGPVFGDISDPWKWVEKVKAAGWAATTCPLPLDSDAYTVGLYRRLAEENNIQISEVGAWSNPISPNDEERRLAIRKCEEALAMADRLGANCAVTISGARGEVWDGPYAANFDPDVFDLIVETFRGIILAVKPVKTVFALEAMPWTPPDSPDSYLEIAQAIDHPKFGVHLDPVNMICTPRRALNSGAFLRECFEKLGPRIANIHAKDYHVSQKLTFHTTEVMPGKGWLDYGVFLREAASLPQDIGFVLEHLSTPEEYQEAARFVRGVAEKEGVAIAVSSQ